MMLVRHWNRVSREAVAATFLELFEARLDGALVKGVPQQGTAHS